MTATVILSILLSGVLAWIFLSVIKQYRLLMALVLVIYLVGYLLNADNRVYSSHGMVHTGFVYHIMGGHIPPDNPYFAGEPLQYPWIYHALVALVSFAINISPGWVFMLFNLVALVSICFLVAKVCGCCYDDETSKPFAVFLAVFGSLGAFLAGLLYHLNVPGFWLHFGVPLARKFIRINAMPLGTAFFVWGMYCSLRSLAEAPVLCRYYWGLGFALLFAGFVYPFAWCGLVITVLSGMVVSLLFKGGFPKNVLICLGILAITTFVLSPYMLALTAGKTAASSLAFTLNPGRFITYCFHLLVMLLPIWILIAMRFKDLLAKLREGHNELRLLSFMSLGLMAAFVIVYAPEGAEYKFRTLAGIGLAILATPSLSRLYMTRKAVTWGFVAIMLLPVTYDLVTQVRMDWPVSEPYLERGYALEHRDKRENQLYQWITKETPANALFIDTKATIPVFGRRPLYVPGKLSPGWDGWVRTPDNWLQWMHGYSASTIAARHRIVDGLYKKTDSVGDKEIIAELERLSSSFPSIYVVARNDTLDTALAERTYLTKAAAGKSWSVYRFLSAVSQRYLE